MKPQHHEVFLYCLNQSPMRRRIIKSLAVLAFAAVLANTALNIFTSENFNATRDEYDYDLILQDISRRLAVSPAHQRINELKRHHAQILMDRGLDPHSQHFKDVLQRKMSNVSAVRGQRGGVRKIKRNLNIGEEVWKGTPMNLKEKKQFRQLTDEIQNVEPLHICERSTNTKALGEIDLLKDYVSTCPGSNNQDMLLLEGVSTFGRTGNNLIEFLHALQLARDRHLTLGIMHGSWAMQVLMQMFMAIQDKDWEKKWEETFCAKILHSDDELEGWNVVRMNTKELFGYTSPSPFDEYVASTQFSIRALFQHYNTGKGTGIRRNKKVEDMCSGIEALFGEEKKHVLYSVIHSRHLEGAPGLRLLGRVCHFAKCHPTAALEMRPDYIKSILSPLGMLERPIVLITDGQDFSVIQRLMTDPEIGPMLKLLPEHASWIGGDLTLAIMSDVFIGNPASTFSTFIAKSRLSLGFGQNYLFRNKNENGEWVTSCGDACVFDKRVMSAMS
ncbi:hypothetical protein HJC23_002231 [Cyclotella cryptica]|uniref:Uncharacterized protein n=1 Tax=Cyclotella cryptica TaxID=29204 RepID=A0ABD3QF88_9STRA|eukprot:CCRYP_005667-RA/>CCRYP_005667-RA protein AED:0.06 eAED:0.06 QI:14/1/1/1/1/1/2/120/500